MPARLSSLGEAFHTCGVLAILTCQAEPKILNPHAWSDGRFDGCWSSPGIVTTNPRVGSRRYSSFFEYPSISTAVICFDSSDVISRALPGQLRAKQYIVRLSLLRVKRRLFPSFHSDPGRGRVAKMPSPLMRSHFPVSLNCAAAAG